VKVLDGNKGLKIEENNKQLTEFIEKGELNKF
jgi:hypothetical protein